MSEWKEYKLGEICSKIGSGATPKGGKEAYRGGDTSLIRSQNVLDFSFSWDGLAYINDEQAAKLNGVEIEKGDVLLNITGDSVARACIVPQSALPARVNQHVSIIRGDATLVINEYILYFLQYKKPYLLSLSKAGATRNALTKGMIEDFPIPLPPLAKQAKIVGILSSLDDKIVVNKKICENLEAQAQALFKHWFVDFAPFKNGRFVESELGLIPEGWRVGTLGDLVEIIDNRGKTPPLCSESIYPIIDVKTLTGEGRIVSYEKCSKFVNQDTYNNWFRSGHPQKGDILLSTVGSLAEMKIFMGGLGCIAQNVVALRNPQKSLYLYDYLNWIKKDLLSYNIGSVQPSIKVTHIIKHKVLIPDQNILLRYQDIVKEITEKSYSNNAEITLLSNIRDNLLPKLMSGQIKV